MSPATDSSSVGRVLRGATAALLFAAAIIQPKAASAAYGGGGFHCGGGSRAGTGSGFHGGGFHGHGGAFHRAEFHRGSEHFGGGLGFGGIMRRIGGATAILTSTTGLMRTIPISGITVTILAAAITAPAPTMATARGPTPGSPCTIAPTPPAIIRMWHSARAAGRRFRRARLDAGQMLGQISIDDRGQNWIGGPEGLGAGARDLGRVILASQQTGIGTGYSRPLFVSAPAAGAATAAFDGRSEASTRYA